MVVNVTTELTTILTLSHQLAQKVRKEHGFIHVVVNNAGIMPCHPLLEHTENEIRLMYEINVLSHFWVS